MLGVKLVILIALYSCLLFLVFEILIAQSLGAWHRVVLAMGRMLFVSAAFATLRALWVSLCVLFTSSKWKLYQRVICTGKENGVDKVEDVGTNSSPPSENVSDMSVMRHVVCLDVPPRENVSGTSIVCSDGLPTSNVHTYFDSLMLKAYGSTLVNSEGEIPSSPWYSR